MFSAERPFQKRPSRQSARADSQKLRAIDTLVRI